MTTPGDFNIKCIICKLWRDTIFSLKDTIFLSKLWSVFNFPGLLCPHLCMFLTVLRAFGLESFCAKQRASCDQKTCFVHIF